MKTIQLHIPDELASRVQRITSNTEEFIVDLLRSKLDELNEPLSLADEYRFAAEENIILMKEFTHVDKEGWSDDY